MRPDLCAVVCCIAGCSAPLLTILAPGAYITAAGITLSGTSQATPFVSAAIAILRTQFPTYTMAQIVNQLTSTGVKVSGPF
jgi:subtilisin family serine protease